MDKEALQMLNMFMTATQIAKTKNVYELSYNIERKTLIELFKKAFPFIKNETSLLSFVDMALKG